MAGQRIDDHSSWIGKGKEYPFPDGAKMKGVKDVEGAGDVMDYPDTAEHIARDQSQGVGKIRGHKMKAGHRY